MELTGQSRQLSEFSAQPFESFLAATVIYMLVTLLVVWLMHVIEARSRLPGMVGSH
jgi:glutamate/aspartate transport system permease protein